MVASVGRVSGKSSVGALVGAASLLLMMTGCGSEHSGPTLVIAGAGSLNDTGVGQSDVKPGGVDTFGGMKVCLDRPGEVTITNVQPLHVITGHVRVVQWGVRPWDPLNGIGDARGDLDHNHFPSGPARRTVKFPCDDKYGRGSELAVSFQMPDNTGFEVQDLKVSYVSNGEHRSMIWPQTSFTMCPRRITGINDCPADAAM